MSLLMNDNDGIQGHIVRVKCVGGDVAVNIHALRAASAHLSATLYPPMAEVVLDVTCYGFQVLVDWLSSGEISCPEADEEEEEEVDEEEQTEDEDGADETEKQEDDRIEKIGLLCTAYQTGCTLEVSSRFLDALMDRIIDSVVEPNERTWEQVIELANVLREAFEIGSSGRLFCAEWLIHGNMACVERDLESVYRLAEWVDDGDDVFRREILQAGFRGAVAPGSGTLPWEQDRCRYHEHGVPRGTLRLR
ncbi:hypothetical protein B0A55_02929 [Friedmanniomyces simplex]|uniref:Uncharacterized protein n=1 Tax=Friedmanniomyces simplex TaxID=329884 RepID=A0A4U0XUI7_9PEZI|nr:hypothetical protein B0A55_02929 [Friedmanniomyces simplex]